MTVTARDIAECEACQTRRSEPGLIHACASVGIERGVSTGRMLLMYLADYHQGGHQDRPSGA